MQNQQPRKQPDALPRRNLVCVPPSDDDSGPNHVCESELGRLQPDDLTKDVQPADDPADDGALFARDEPRGCRVSGGHQM